MGDHTSLVGFWENDNTFLSLAQATLTSCHQSMGFARRLLTIFRHVKAILFVIDISLVINLNPLVNLKI